MVSLIFLFFLAIISIIAPLLAPLPINQQDLLNIKGDMSSHNILGTDSEEETILADYYMQGEFLLTID